MQKIQKRRRLLLDALHTFESAARNESFADAAWELSVTASGISHQIRRLEDNLDVQLFDRTSKYPTLTNAGKRLAASLHPLFGQLHAAIDDLRTSTSSNLSLSVMSAFGATWLAGRALDFARGNPDIALRVSTSDELIDLHAENIDLGIRFGAGAYPGLVSELLMPVEVFPVCSPAFLSAHATPLKAPSDLLHSVLIHDESSSRSPLLPSWTTWFERAGVPVDAMRYAITFQDPRMAQEAALAGHGFAMGMSCLVGADIAAGRLVAPFSITLPSAFSFWLVCSEARATAPKVMRFKDWIKRQAAAQQAQACAVR